MFHVLLLTQPTSPTPNYTCPDNGDTLPLVMVGVMVTLMHLCHLKCGLSWTSLDSSPLFPVGAHLILLPVTLFDYEGVVRRHGEEASGTPTATVEKRRKPELVLPLFIYLFI